MSSTMHCAAARPATPPRFATLRKLFALSMKRRAARLDPETLPVYLPHDIGLLDGRVSRPRDFM